MSEIWTPPRDVEYGTADSDRYNTEVVGNLRYLKEVDDERGVKGFYYNDSSSTARTTSGLFTMSTPSFPIYASRNYRIYVSCQMTMNAAGVWHCYAAKDGVALTDFGRMIEADNIGVFLAEHFLASVDYFPDADDAAASFGLYGTEIAGAATLTIAGAAEAARMLWVEDTGPRRVDITG